LRFVFYSGGWQEATSTSTVSMDIWVHIAVTFDRPKVHFYINGSDDGEKTFDYALPTNTEDLLLGGYTFNNRFHNGTIDEIRIYNRPLNSTEISYSYNSGNGRHMPLNQTGLVAWYHFNEGSGTTINDVTANNNDGTLNGDTDEWITGKVLAGTPKYPSNIIISELEVSYQAKLYNSTDGLITNATANSEGTANMTLPNGYRESTFEGIFRIYDTNATFIYSKWFEDIKGGDIYEARTKIGGLTFGVIALVIGLFALVLALASVKVKR